MFTNHSSPSDLPFTSVLSLNLAGIIDPNLVHVTYGLSKDFGSAGLKIGALITRNEALKKAVHAVLRFSSVSGPSVAIATAMLEDRVWCREIISLARARIWEAYKRVTSILDRMDVMYFDGNNAGFFLWIDLSAYLPPDDGKKSALERECMFAQKCVDAGIFLQPGEEHSIRPGWWRIVYTMDKEMVEIGLGRLEGVLKSLKWGEDL